MLAYELHVGCINSVPLGELAYLQAKPSLRTPHARRECLDWLLIVNRRHLERVLRVFVDHYNVHRPHRSLDLTPPVAIGRDEWIVSCSPSAEVKRRDRLGGLIHEYSYAA